jgi:hypothetical protein
LRQESGGEGRLARENEKNPLHIALALEAREGDILT